MIGNAFKPGGQRRLTAIETTYTSEGLDKHILIHFLGILTAGHDTLHHAIHGRTIRLEQPLACSWFLLLQLANQNVCLLFHLMLSTYIYTQIRKLLQR